MRDVTEFGKTADGHLVHCITLRAGDLQASVLTWGAVLQSVQLAGVAYDLTLGSDRLADYESDMRYHGSLIAPVVNRLTDATAMVAGTRQHFEVNFNNRHNLHSGGAGTHLKVWQLIEAAETHVVLALSLPDGEGGFPGNRRVEARFSIAAPASLRLQVTATTDAPTIFNAANHSYWNLDGTETWAGHRVEIAADHYLPTTDDFIPTGDISGLTGSALDFRNPMAIAPGHPDLDNCFCLGTARMPLRDVMALQGTSGVRLTVATTEPGVQLYDGRHAARPGHSAYEGIAIEAQGWPDAPNHPAFPQIELQPGHPLQQITEWRFARV